MPTNDELLRYAANNPPPQEWYDEEPQSPPSAGFWDSPEAQFTDEELAVIDTMDWSHLEDS